MGLLVVCKGADFSDCAVDKVKIPDEPVVPDVPDEPIVPVTIEDYPVKDTLFGLYDLGGTMDASLINRAPAENITSTTAKAELNAPGGTIDTTLTDDKIFDNYIKFSGAMKRGRMLTKINAVPEDKITAVALFRVPMPDNPTADNIHRVIIGNRGSNAIGVNMMNDYVFYGTDGANTAVVTNYEGGAINSDDFVILAMQVDTAGVKVMRYTNGVFDDLAMYEGSINSWSTSATTYAFQIGGNGTSSTYGDADISLAAIHKGDMTDGQLTEICKFVKAYGEQKGLTIE